MSQSIDAIAEIQQNEADLDHTKRILRVEVQKGSDIHRRVRKRLTALIPIMVLFGGR